jgi:NADH-quinone oxidoreductase subunit L
MDVIWLVPLVPAAAAAVNGLAGVRLFNRTATALVGCGSIAATAVLSVLALMRLTALAPEARVIEAPLGTWIPASPLATARGMGAFEVPWALRLDPLAAVMILVVTGVALLIHVYAAAYMQDEPRRAYARFFCYLNLFCAFMLLLALSANLLVMFVGWEGVSLCSYLLIGFWYEKRSAAVAGFKAFLVNRIGDWGFVVGILLVFFSFGTLDFHRIAVAASALPIESGGAGVLSLVCLLLLAGAAGKSAQMPLHVWLPDAMEGPTPVSALIHAATMVTAGVYMVARNATLFAHAPIVMTTMAIVGVVTALLAAAVATVQTDIKRVLAYSTMSQLGLMFLAAGTGAFAAAVFHLVTHALFKALLFLGSGAVIHAMAGEQDLRRMGGLRRAMPVTALTMAVGALALAGMPPLAGFFSKDEILYRAFLGSPALWGVAVSVSLLTAFYVTRLLALAFAGTYRGPGWQRQASPAAAEAAATHGVRHPRDAHAHGQAQRDDHEVTHGAADALGSSRHWDGPHEAPIMMRAPLLLLAAGTLVVGFLGVPAALGGTHAFERFLTPSLPVASAATAIDTDRVDRAIEVPHPQSEGPAISLLLVALAVAVAGILAARRVYIVRPGPAWQLAQRWPGIHALLSNSFYIDDVYGATLVRGTWAAARRLLGFDLRVVDAVVDGAGVAVRIGAWISHMLDTHLVDGLGRAVAAAAGFGGGLLRRGQTGLLQNYALTMVAGVLVLLTFYALAIR